MPSREASFDTKIYSMGAVKEAVDAFAEFGTFEVTEEKHAVTVRAELEERSIRQVWGEFQNFVLINS